MKIVEQLQRLTSEAIQKAYDVSVPADEVVVRATRSDQDGDFTIVTFGLAKALKDRPDAIAAKIGNALIEGHQTVASTEVVKGFLNVTLSARYWRETVLAVATGDGFGIKPKTGQRIIVESASPNTNKPLHLGHVRNILLGWSASKILEAAGHTVTRVQIINDRGIAICKSMLAWERFAEGATPTSTGSKSDHFVGDYYVKFEQAFQEEYAAWQLSAAGQAALAEVVTKEGESAAGKYKNTYFNTHSKLGAAAREMLLKWEDGDPEVRALWSKMNTWCYQGFDATYERLGVRFDKLYYESDTYLLGKKMVDEGLAKDVFFRKADGSVWVDLTGAKLDEKVVLRADGTSVYVTQDLGTAHQRYLDFNADRMVYVVGDEQNYHFEVLFATLKKLGEPYADQLDHLSYGMIDLITGKMKSRQGNVVDADDLMAEVVAEAKASAEERAETQSAELIEASEEVGLAAIKYFILRVGPQKRMIFDPKESVELQGATGPYIQYSYVRANSVSNKAAASETASANASAYDELAPAERDLAKHLLTLPDVVEAAAEALDPSLVAAYAYNLAKGYHRFWHDHSILSAESPEARAFRVELSRAVAKTLHTSMDLLGISLPKRM